jgi:signal transduction histidine kinase/CheY-like chemotaxis protein
VPMYAAAEPIGTLALAASAGHRLDADYQTFMGLVARQTASLINGASAYRAQQRRAEELAELDRAKTTFFSNISHEFRTPLTLIMGPVQDLRSRLHDADPGVREDLDLVRRNGLRLGKLVNALLDFSRVEAGRIQAVYQPTDLAALTHDLASSFRSACEKAGLALTIATPPLSEPVFVDHEMWEKIVLNLISNAFKFTLEGGIRIDMSEAAGHAVLRVSDTGIGIPESEAPRIFDRFHRVEGARGRTHEGTGIGLALVKELIELHHGAVAVESSLGKGTTFIVRVPFGHAHLPQDRLEASRTQASTATRAEAFVSEALRWLPDGMTAPELDAPDEPLLTRHGRKGEGAHVLLADDNADMRDYLCRLLGATYEVTAAADGEEAFAAARHARPDLILTDVMMPRLDGFGLLQKLRGDPELRGVPVIILSARAGEEAKVEGLQTGADDYLVKPFSARELLARVAANIELSRTRLQSERILQQEAHILELLNRVGTAVAAELDLEPAVQMVTDAATDLSGAAFGSFFYNVIDEKGEAYTLYTLSGAPREAFARFPMPRNTAVFGPTFNGDGVIRSDDITADPRYGKNAPHRGMPKGHLPVRSYLATPVKSRSGEVLGGLFFGHPDVGVFTERAERIVAAIAVQAGIAIDKARLYRAAKDEIARRKRVEAQLRESEQMLEAKVAERTAQLMAEVEEREKALHALQKTQEQLAQAQKLEGIGHLTGGVAHDFNNLLTIIMGNLEALQRAAQNPQADEDRFMRLANNAMRGAQRAAALTQRLLAFSRQQPLDPKVLDMSRLVAGMSDLLRRTLGEQVAIETVLAGGLWRVHVDPNQLEVTILNLAVNARDAMPEGGRLTIETANTFLDENYAASQAEVLSGQYVVICVTDTGRGMPRDVIERAFEPFFTTKDVGHGTGLGLSQVYGFVKQSGGHVKIYSEVGQGTSVKIYLPRLHAAEEKDELVPEPRAAPSRSYASETILVVEDEDDVRTHAKEILNELGYRTLEADTGRRALQILQTHPEIQLLFTDVGLPGGMNGRQLAEAARRLRADLKVLMTTGYARNAIVHDSRVDPGVQLISKPFSYSALAAKIRNILDAPARSGRILLVEDELPIQRSAVERLESLGFKIETAGSVAEAMSKLKLVGDLEAAIIHVVPADRKAEILVSEVRAIYPAMAIVIATGSTEDPLRQRFGGDQHITFLSQPYLAEHLRKALASLNVVSG